MVLLGSAFGFEFIGNTKYFYLYLLNNLLNKNKLEYYWITRSKKIFFDFKIKKWPIVYLYSVRGLWLTLRAKYFLIEQSTQGITGINILFCRFNVFNFWHGVPLKKIFFDDKFIKGFKYFFIKRKEWSIYKYILSKSNDSAKNIETGFKNKNVVKLGYPRDDVFFQKDLQYINYKKALKLENYKIYCYIPTYRDKIKKYTPFGKVFLFELNKYFKKNNIMFLVKKHRDDGVIEINNNLSNIMDVSDKVKDVQDLLIDTDLLISDYSSVVFDYVLLDRPVILYCYDYEKYINNCRNMYYDYFKDMAGPFAKNENELFSLIKNIKVWHSNKEYQIKYKEFKERFNLFKDGKSSERIYNFLINKNT